MGPFGIFTESADEINSHNVIPRINSGFTSHILFHVLYKDINNGKNYKRISVLEAQAYLHKLVSSDVTKSAILFFAQNTILRTAPALILVPCFQCRLLQIRYSVKCMNNGLAKYLCTF